MADPYGEQALLTSAMAEGYDAVPAVERERLLRYLEAVVAVRRAPVHAAVAFNAVYFGYDLAGEGYGCSPLRLDDFPAVTLGESVPALPVGAMVCVATGSDPLYAEVVYKEGAHPEIGALGDVPAWVSGAPAGAEGPGGAGTETSPRRRELLVPDPHAFGPGLSLSPAQLHRLRTHQRWINEDGHVVVDACYPSQEAVRRDDLSAYADYLLTTARAQLLSPFVPVSLAELVGGTHDEALRTGLIGLLDVVRRSLASSEMLRMWGPYAMTRAALAACWRDTGPLGGADMRSLVAAVEHASPSTPVGPDGTSNRFSRRHFRGTRLTAGARTATQHHHRTERVCRTATTSARGHRCLRGACRSRASEPWPQHSTHWNSRRPPPSTT
ncbi:hypothetical protein [Streptomyces sp. NPDC048196]|uniref:hypothetical protein n=1 Tax=Streptomyces sp. NPDC048196 TaxID=3154712 RepID=UPI0033C1081F